MTVVVQSWSAYYHIITNTRVKNHQTWNHSSTATSPRSYLGFLAISLVVSYGTLAWMPQITSVVGFWTADSNTLKHCQFLMLYLVIMYPHLWEKWEKQKPCTAGGFGIQGMAFSSPSQGWQEGQCQIYVMVHISFLHPLLQVHVVVSSNGSGPKPGIIESPTNEPSHFGCNLRPTVGFCQYLFAENGVHPIKSDALSGSVASSNPLGWQGTLNTEVTTLPWPCLQPYAAAG